MGHQNDRHKRFTEFAKRVRCKLSLVLERTMEYFRVSFLHKYTESFLSLWVYYPGLHNQTTREYVATKQYQTRFSGLALTVLINRRGFRCSHMHMFSWKHYLYCAD